DAHKSAPRSQRPEANPFCAGPIPAHAIEQQDASGGRARHGSLALWRIHLQPALQVLADALRGRTFTRVGRLVVGTAALEDLMQRARARNGVACDSRNDAAGRA